MEVASLPYRPPEPFSAAHRPHTDYRDARSYYPSPPITHRQVHNSPPHYSSMEHSSPKRHASSMHDDRSKPSLPSISNLLGIADGERGSQHETASTHNLPTQQPTPPDQTAYAQSISHRGSGDGVSVRGAQVPPTPPMRSISGVDAAHSPSNVSTHSSHHAYSSAEHARHSTVPSKRPSIGSQGHPGYSSTSHGVPPYMTSPSATSTSSCYSNEGANTPGPAQQRALPATFPPAHANPMPASVHTSNPWEHHHYLSASSQASFPSVQDRYVCATCKKAFSRPSSLKIHSHSHTGEKPFKCPHSGCGKSFSVRSNMKRHERGCHSGDGAITTQA